MKRALLVFLIASALPAVILAIALGVRLARRIDARRFVIAVHVGLFLSGAGLLIQSLL